MPFQKGHKLAKGGPRPGSGRPSKQDVEAAERAENVFKRVIEGKTASVASHYYKRIFENDAVLLDARKKLWPDDLDGTQQTGDTFIQFNFGSIAVPKPVIEVGLHNGNGRSFDGGALHIGSDEGGSE